MVTDSRIKGLYDLSVDERIERLVALGVVAGDEAELLRQGRYTLPVAAADKMIENVVGIFGLPLAVAPNFVVNGREYLVPMVVEEPSVVAAVSNAALLARQSGGFKAKCEESLLIGQVHVSGIQDVSSAIERVNGARNEIVKRCNAVHPRLVERGGGVRDFEVRKLGDDLMAVHLLVDTCDAMGANLVNSICEAIAPKLGELCDGNVALRILSNLTDRSLVCASVSYKLDDEVRDGIVLASKIATSDPYRAATHNKGLMNGVDAVAIATGNDWRAIEAGVHAHAVKDGRYSPIATWSTGEAGNLVGELSMPLKVGIVGGNREANPGASLGLQIAGVDSAIELAELMAAVGLAQNFAALRALATSGIQQGHMKLHARAARLREQPMQLDTESADGAACGKVILLGEHAVVYGRHALALPVRDAVTATLVDGDVADTDIPELDEAIELIKRELGIADTDYSVEVASRIPLGMGLGASAALAVAITRAFNTRLDLGLDDAAVNEVAFACEKLAHGTPSGIDNTIATFGQAMLFRNADTLERKAINVGEVPPVVVACSDRKGRTKEQVAGVRVRFDQSEGHYDAVFNRIDALAVEGADALAENDYERLGRAMNVCHGLLNAIEVSTPELEGMISIARVAGACGAKLTGAGGGGSIVALCPGKVAEVRNALQTAGYATVDLA